MTSGLLDALAKFAAPDVHRSLWQLGSSIAAFLSLGVDVRVHELGHLLRKPLRGSGELRGSTPSGSHGSGVYACSRASGTLLADATSLDRNLVVRPF